MNGRAFFIQPEAHARSTGISPRILEPLSGISTAVHSFCRVPFPYDTMRQKWETLLPPPNKATGTRSAW